MEIESLKEPAVLEVEAKALEGDFSWFINYQGKIVDQLDAWKKSYCIAPNITDYAELVGFSAQFATKAGHGRCNYDGYGHCYGPAPTLAHAR